MNKEGSKKISRREFLKKAGSFAAGAIAGGIVGKEISKNEIEKLKQEKESIENNLKKIEIEIQSLKEENQKLKQEKESLKEENQKLKDLLEGIKKQVEPKKLKVISTAYTAGQESTGKTPEHPEYGVTFSGWKADIGTIAVDPNVIELGSIVYIPGYGYAIALDTGGAIKGNRIDLFFHNVKEALNWGVREVEIIVIGKIENFALVTEKLKELGLVK